MQTHTVRQEQPQSPHRISAQGLLAESFLPGLLGRGLGDLAQPQDLTGQTLIPPQACSAWPADPSPAPSASSATYLVLSWDPGPQGSPLVSLFGGIGTWEPEHLSDLYLFSLFRFFFRSLLSLFSLWQLRSAPPHPAPPHQLQLGP